MRIGKRLIIGILLISACSTQKEVIKERNLELKNYSCSRCLDLVYKEELKADGSSMAYFNKSNFDVNVFEQLDSITREYVDTKVMNSKFSNKLGIMKCIEFQNSAYLDSTIVMVLNK